VEEIKRRRGRRRRRTHPSNDMRVAKEAMYMLVRDTITKTVEMRLLSASVLSLLSPFFPLPPSYSSPSLIPPHNRSASRRSLTAGQPISCIHSHTKTHAPAQPLPTCRCTRACVSVCVCVCVSVCACVCVYACSGVYTYT